MYHFFFFFIPFSFHSRWWLFFFLKQGEYIAPEKIQNAYLRSPFVAHAFVIGNSFEALKLNSSLNKHILPFQSFLVAVIVPDAEVIEAWAKKNEVEGDVKQLCQDEVNKFTEGVRG